MAKAFSVGQRVQCGQCREDGTITMTGTKIETGPATYEVVVQHSLGVEHRIVDDVVEATIALPGEGPLCRSKRGTTTRCVESLPHELHRGRNNTNGEIETWPDNGTETTG